MRPDADPDHAVGTKQLHGTKKSKSRLTACMCGNADRSDKCPIWLVERRLSPRAFKGVPLGANKTAWNNKILMIKWLLGFNHHVKVVWLHREKTQKVIIWNPI